MRKVKFLLLVFVFFATFTLIGSLSKVVADDESTAKTNNYRPSGVGSLTKDTSFGDSIFYVYNGTIVQSAAAHALWQNGEMVGSAYTHRIDGYKGTDTSNPTVAIGFKAEESGMLRVVGVNAGSTSNVTDEPSTWPTEARELALVYKNEELREIVDSVSIPWTGTTSSTAGSNNSRFANGIVEVRLEVPVAGDYYLCSITNNVHIYELEFIENEPTLKVEAQHAIDNTAVRFVATIANLVTTDEEWNEVTSVKLVIRVQKNNYITKFATKKDIDIYTVYRSIFETKSSKNGTYYAVLVIDDLKKWGEDDYVSNRYSLSAQLEVTKGDKTYNSNIALVYVWANSN